MGQVLAVQELLCLLCLHDQAAKMFSSSKKCCSRIDSEKQARPPLAAVSDHSGNPSDPHAHGHMQGRMVITEAQRRAVNHADM